MLLVEQGTAKDTHDLVDVSFKLHLMFYDCNETVCTYRRINLYSDGSLRVAPERFYPKMLLYPFEEQFHLPAIFVKEYDLFGREVKVIGVKRERSFEVRHIGFNSSDYCRIVFLITVSGKSYSLVTENVAVVVEIEAIFHLVGRTELFPYHKEGVKLLYLEKPLEVPISAVENVSCQWFIFNDIHRINVMNGCIGYMDHGRNLRDNVKLGMKFYARLCTSELRPIINAHAKVYGGGVESIELPSYAELSVYPCFLSQCYYVIGKLLEYMPVPIVVTSRQDASIHGFFAESEMKGFLPVCGRYVCQFPQTPTSEELPEHEDEQLAPIGQLPTQGGVFNSSFDTIRHDSFKFTLWQKVSDLTENISSCIHEFADWECSPKIAISKVRQVLQYLNAA